MAHLGVGDAGGRRAQQLAVDRQLPPERHADPRVLGGEGIDLRGKIVFDMAGGEQHPGQTDDALGAPRLQRLQSVADDRPGKFEETALDVAVGQTVAQVPRDGVEFANSREGAAAVAADHNAEVVGHRAWSLAFERL